jgi:hypothetical protein
MGAQWSFNRNGDTPTFSPSIMVTWDFYPGGVEAGQAVKKVCHSFIREGRIEYLGDCTHELAGQTVDMPDWED